MKSSIEMKNELKNELKSLGSLLENMPHQEYHGREVAPSLDGYEATILNLVKDTKPSEPKSTNMWKKLMKPAAIAAMIVMAFSIFLLVNQNASNQNLDKLSYSEMKEFVDDESLEIELDKVVEEDTLSIETLSDEEIINYLKEIEGMEMKDDKSGKI